MLHEKTLDCPYCGERFETLVDTSSGSANYIEDCQVCCRPIEVALEADLDGNLVTISTSTGDE